MEANKTLWRFFSFGEETHPEGQPYWWINRNRPSSVNVIQYTLKGTLRHVTDGKESLIQKNQALLFNYEDQSEYGIRTGDKSYSCFWISLTGSGITEHWNLIRQLYGSVLDDPDGTLLNLLRESVKFSAFSDEQDPVRAAERTSRFVMQLMKLLERQSRKLTSPAERAVARIRNNPYYPWSIKELTEEEGCSREHFFRVFKELHQTTPAAWLAEKRIRQARYLLLTTRLTAEDIALQCGFSGAHSMARTLRRTYGQSPAQLRSSNKTA